MDISNLSSFSSASVKLENLNISEDSGIKYNILIYFKIYVTFFKRLRSLMVLKNVWKSWIINECCKKIYVIIYSIYIYL